MMKRVLSWALTAILLVSCCATMVFPAVAAENPLVNLYNDATDGYAARADNRPNEVTKGNPTPHLVASTEYITTEPISVSGGDTLYFGPANAGQGYQAFFYPASGTPSQIGGGSCTKVFAFDGTLATSSSASASNKEVVVYAYTAPSAGQVRITFPQEYHEFFMVTKNQPITSESFYAYFDSKENANLWNRFLDLKKLLNTDGTVGTNTNHYATHYIPVKAGDTITFGPHKDTMYVGAVGYDAEKVGVTGHLYTGSVSGMPISAGMSKIAAFTDENLPKGLTQGQSYGIYSYTVPEGVAFVRVTLYKEVSPYFMVQKNNVFDIKGYWDLMGGDMESSYFGADSFWVGDSIGESANDLKTHGLDGWAGRVSKALNMNWVNNSKGGWSLSTGRLNTQYSRIVGRLFDGLATEPKNGYDLVMLHGGTNDAWSPVPVGSMTDSFYPADFNINTYAGGLEELFYYATTLYGDTAEINYILNFKMTGRTNANDVHQMDNHYAMALQICEKWGVTPIDLYHDDAVTAAFSPRTMKCTSDFVHPGYRGYDVLTPFITDKLLDASTGNTWDADSDTVIGKINAGLRAGIAADTHFTADSKATVAAAANSGTNREKLNAALAAAPSLQQKTENRISINDLTKYQFMDPKEFTVSNGKDMNVLGHYVNNIGYVDEDVTIYQTNDIDMASYSGFSVGAAKYPFKATFDGQGYQLKNWRRSSTDNLMMALFPYISGATVKNVTLKNADCTGAGWASLLAGAAMGADNRILNCHVVDSALSKETGNGMSAILLQANDRGANSQDAFLIKDCTVSGCTFNVNTAAGGSATNMGWISSRVFTANQVIENCYVYNNTVNVKNAITVSAVGGMVSEGKNGKIINSGVYNNKINNAGGATIDASMNSALVGYVMNGSTFTLSGCYSDSALPLAGAPGATNATNCYSVGAGTTTLEEIKSGILAATLAEKTEASWGMKEIAEGLSIPMVGEDLEQVLKIQIGSMVFYTDTEGKINLGDRAEALAGKIWKLGNETMLTADLANRTYKAAEAWSETAYLYGDCMGGNTLDTADAVALMRALLGDIREGYQADRADVNCDGQVSLADVVRLLRYIAAGRSV